MSSILYRKLKWWEVFKFIFLFLFLSFVISGFLLLKWTYVLISILITVGIYFVTKKLLNRYELNQWISNLIPIICSLAISLLLIITMNYAGEKSLESKILKVFQKYENQMKLLNQHEKEIEKALNRVRPTDKINLIFILQKLKENNKKRQKLMEVLFNELKYEIKSGVISINTTGRLQESSIERLQSTFSDLVMVSNSAITDMEKYLNTGKKEFYYEAMRKMKTIKSLEKDFVNMSRETFGKYRGLDLKKVGK